MIYGQSQKEEVVQRQNSGQAQEPGLRNKATGGQLGRKLATPAVASERRKIHASLARPACQQLHRKRPSEGF